LTGSASLTAAEETALRIPRGAGEVLAPVQGAPSRHVDRVWRKNRGDRDQSRRVFE